MFNVVIGQSQFDLVRAHFGGCPVISVMAANRIYTSDDAVISHTLRTSGPLQGRSWYGNGTDAIALATLKNSFTLNAHTGITLAVLYRAWATDSAAIGGLGSTSGGAGNTLCRIVGASAANKVKFQIQLSDGGLLYNTESNGALVSTTGWRHVVVPAGFGSGETCEYWINGQFNGSVTRSATNANATVFHHMNAVATSRGGSLVSPSLSHHVALVAALDGRMCSAAAQALSRNVWQLFQARRRSRVWFAPGSGSIYSVDVSESVTATDSVSNTATIAGSLSETASATDTLTTIATLLASFSETASATDSASSAATVAGTVSESGSAADQVTAGAAIYSVDVSEAATAVDSISAVLTAGAALAESASASDTVSNIVTLLAQLAESVSATDSYSSALNSATYNVSLSEAASAVDSIAAQLAAAVALAETGTASDSLSTLAAFGVAVAEAVAALDAVSATGITNVSITETAIASDLVNAPTGFGEVPASRTITVTMAGRTITVTATNRTIRVH